MLLGRRITRQVRGAFETVAHSVDYAKHLIRGNNVPGEMSWIREGVPPVVLVHGFLGTRGSMLPLSRRFLADGRVVFSYAYGMLNLAPVEVSAQGLVAQVQSICEDLKVEKVDLVGYSMGGMLGLYATKFLGGERWIRRIVMLGTPMRGSWLGYAGVATLGAISPGVWQLLPGSNLLQELRSRPLPSGVRVCQIHAKDDAFCPEPGRLAGILPHDYIVLPGGHSSLVVAEPFYQAACDFLDGVRLPDEPTYPDPNRPHLHRELMMTSDPSEIVI